MSVHLSIYSSKTLDNKDQNSYLNNVENFIVRGNGTNILIIYRLLCDVCEGVDKLSVHPHGIDRWGRPTYSLA